MAKTPSKTPSKTPAKKSSLDGFFKRSPKSPTRAAKSPTKAKSPAKSPSKESYPSEPCDIAPGWTVKTIPRKPGSSIVKDRYYYDPSGNMFRSRKEALKSLGIEEGSEKKRGRTSVGKKEKEASPKKSNGRSKSPKKKAKYPTGTVLSKRFPDPDASDGERSFSGTIAEFDAKNGLYKVVYEDDDSEELSEGEVEKLVKPKAKKTNGAAAKASPKKTNGAAAKASPKKTNGAAAKSSPKKTNGAAAKASPKKTNGAAAKSSPTKTNSPKFPIGAQVTKEFMNDEFGMATPHDGSIAAYNPTTKKYTIFFPEDSHQEEVDEEEIAKIFVPKFKKGTKVAKDDGLNGIVGSFDKQEGMYHIHFKNQTSEKLTEGEVEDILADKPKSAKKTSVKEAKKTKKVAKLVDSTDEEESSSESVDVEEKKPAATNGRRRATKKVNYKIEDSDDEPSSEEDKPKAKKAKKAGVKKPAKGKKKIIDSDSDDFAPGEESEDDVLMDDALPSDDEEEEEFEEKKPTKKKAAPKKAAAKKEKSETGGKSKMSEVSAKDCTNNPGYFRMSRKEIKETQTFLDPCGMEATDDIIDRLVGHQLDKIKGLLGKALTGDALGSQKNPLVLGTACSGTDAPALALMLVQEQLEARGMGGMFKHKHVFSCEKEPYKQAYLARNFDSVLYPDIVKLCDDPPRDVYGQEQPLPDFNIFVAGTSCKNFSMMMSNKRLDIEDHGCSGETFLAACELLMKDKPKFAIFENVTKAPWEKMSEYITGRLKLSSVDSGAKAIKGASKGKEGELELIWDGEKILTHKVPSQVGVQCGAAIKGYTKGESRKIHDVSWPSSSKKTCTLTELIKHNGIDKKKDTLYIETDVVYCTHHMKVDTKQFGLPQTRERTYMFVWQPEDGNVDDDLGKYWEAVVNHLQFPVRHALESFILEANHDVIRVFREALNGPAGRYTMRAVNQAPDFWDKANANANLPHNLNTRAAMGMDEYARPQTKWGPYGKMQVPPHWWLEYIKCKEQRCVDMIDILHAAAARDAESHDSNFASYFWNISQNVSREKHRTSRSGIAGCITPGGDVFLPHQGRPLLGCEKLLLQGIPYFRLLLGNETEVQLGDLAGNAMSLTVVNATMLAAMTCKQLRKEHEKSSKKTIADTLKALSKADSGLETIEEAMEIDEEAASATSDTKTLFQTLSDISEDAIKSSIWCTCETSGRKSRTCQFVQCRLCGVACCRDCCHVDQGYQLDSHDIKDVSLEEHHDPSSFEIKLRGILPASLSLSSDGISEIASISKDKYRVAGLSKYTYGLHQIKQSRMRWIAVYYARDEKTSEALAELKIMIGKLEQKTDDAGQIVGVQCELTSFVPAKREPFQFGPMEVCATARQCRGEKELTWRARDADTTTTLSVVGSNESPSFRIQVGLNDDAVKGLKIGMDTQKKQYQEAKARGEERRWAYTKNWKVWPAAITISDNSVLGGTYKRIKCQQTLNQSACWIRKQTNDCPELYFLIKPDVGRIEPDVAIISSSTNYTDASSILATFPIDWQPCDSLDVKKQSVSKVSVTNYRALSMTCSAFTNTFTVESPKVDDSPLFVKVNRLSEKDVSDLCCRDDEPGLKSVVSLNVHRGAKAQQTVRRFNLLCVAPILKHAAANGLKYELSLNSTWNRIEPNGEPFGLCRKTIPPRPVESWSFDTERGIWERQSEPGASRRYFLALQEAPQCFRFIVDRTERSLAINCHPQVAAHHAAYGLIDGRGDGLERGVSVDFRLLSVQEDPILDRFRLHNCHDLPETQVPLRGQYELYERQKKAVTKMRRIENEEVEFEEIEMNEQTMPGATGWSIIARASRMTKLRGGVIADAIGAGKTVISIAIILQGIAAARKKREFPRKSSASLVVVPPGLIDQWKREVQKFTTEMPKVICIYDDTAVGKTSLQQILDADMVICPVDLLEAKGYMSRLARVAAGVKDEKQVPQLPKETGQVEKNGASGVWIPATSQDPFGGANNPKSQQRRNESAYFTHVYHDYIHKLREKEFEPQQKGIPLEYFEWERVFIDEIHECLCTSKDELKEAKASKDDSAGFFKEKNRRAGREFLGITTKDTSKRPLVFRKAIFGLTATPLLDSTNRVIELANLMGNAYVIGLSSHWRNLERESGRDIFLSNFLEPKQSREIRKNIYSKCQDYLDRSCCKNKNEEDMEGIEKVHVRETINMSEEEGVLYKKSQSGMTVPSYSTKVEDFDVTAGHDISKFLRQNASLVSRGKKLVEICKNVISEKGNEHTKIIVFADGRIGAGNVARDFLMKEEGLGCTWLDESDTVQEKNQKLAWYQYADVTEEDKKRPRVLVLHFEHAAGLNLQAECNNLILFTPLYVGDGGTSGDVVADVSTEMQAIGRVFRPGQPKPKVFIYRIEVKGPNGEECLDGQLIRRNTDKDTEQMAVNADD